MLVISRHRDEWMTMIEGGRIVARVAVVDIRGDKVRLGIEAPPEVMIFRDELEDAIRESLAGTRPARWRAGG